MKKFLFSRGAVGTAAVIAAFVALPASAALADPSSSSCPTMVVSQPFLSYGDSNYYTLAPGQSLDSFDGTGWTLAGGASIVTTTLADGTQGAVLDLPPGASASSPVMCIQSGMPLARAFTQSVGAPKNNSIKFQVRNADGSAFAGATGIPTPAGWALTDPVAIAPGNFPGVRPVYFTFSANGNQSDVQLSNFYVDPRMWW
jgi:hypothetical protein